MIGGNVQAILQIKSEISSEIGESKYKWSNGISLNGYLDLSGGDSHYVEELDFEYIEYIQPFAKLFKVVSETSTFKKYNL